METYTEARCMSFYDPGQRDFKEIAPGVTIRTFWGDKVLLSLVDIRPGATVPLHTHPHEQAGIVLAGELEMTIGKETKALKAGAVYVVPGGVGHSVQNVRVPTRALDIFSPVREEYKY